MRVLYDPSAYYEAKSKLPKPDGKHCILCGKDLPKGQRKYCSRECFLNWYKSINVQDWSVFKWQAFERDNFTCQQCGVQSLPVYVEYGGKKYIQDMPELECDHIIPIFLGGEEFDLNNLQTLCPKCHKAKTKQEAKERRKISKLIREGIQQRLLEESKVSEC